jgi:hypothetical protein
MFCLSKAMKDGVVHLDILHAARNDTFQVEAIPTRSVSEVGRSGSSLTLRVGVRPSRMEYNGAMLPEGTTVRVERMPARTNPLPVKETPTLFDSLESFIGKAEGLSADLSVNLDCYLYGTNRVRLLEG